jgi:exonuclease 3'-5' domain-containing protein 1
VRNDSDALFAHYGVALQGVEDVQLMDSAARRTTAERRLLNGLSKTLERHVFPWGEYKGGTSWKENKQVFQTKYGGSYEAFNTRPIPDNIVAYCVGDVQYLPGLRERLFPSFFHPLANERRDLVIEKSMKRVAASQQPD